jgi:hypothetical protein
MKIVINKCYGGFGLSALAVKEYLKLKKKDLFVYKQIKYSFSDGVDMYQRVSEKGDEIMTHFMTEDLGEFISKLPNKGYFSDCRMKRDDPDLISVVEKLGDAASGRFANLKIVEIPDGVDYEIEEYDGTEWIAEKHNTWG